MVPRTRCTSCVTAAKRAALPFNVTDTPSREVGRDLPVVPKSAVAHARLVAAKSLPLIIT